MIKVTTDKKGSKVSKYPRLMETPRGSVILMTTGSTGTMVKKGADSNDQVGKHDTDWNVIGDYTGSITIENK